MFSLFWPPYLNFDFASEFNVMKACSRKLWQMFTFVWWSQAMLDYQQIFIRGGSCEYYTSREGQKITERGWQKRFHYTNSILASGEIFEQDIFASQK